MSQRPSFAVVTVVVTVLSLLGFATKLLQPLIPPPKPNRLIGETGDFLIQGATQAINWRTLDGGAFAEARRLDKPVFIVVGAPWSKMARDVDHDAFGNNEVQNYLNRNFICVRVDSLERPDWVNAYLPVSRIKIGFLPGLQIWVLDAKGRLFDFVGRINPGSVLDHNAMLGLLVNARAAFDKLSNNSSAEPELLTNQHQDLAMIEDSPEASPDFLHHFQALNDMADPVNGGFPEFGNQTLRPNAWRYLLLSGHAVDCEQSMAGVMRSPMTDLLDGGFFRMSETTDWRSIQFDKIAVTNAEMMTTLAILAKERHNELAQYLAERTFNSLSGEFVSQGLVAACRIGDDTLLSRSKRSSFSPRRLRSVFPDAGERRWAVDNLGLAVETNPRMVAFISGKDVLSTDRDRMDQYLAKLRAASGSEGARFGGVGLTDVNGFVVARLLSTARLWGDRARIQTALNLFDGMEQFRSEDDVVHGMSPTAHTVTFLSDYLAYSDAALEAYLCTGRTSTFDTGLRVLQRARFLFAGKAPGEFLMSQRPTGSLGPIDAYSPEIVDNICESTSARMIRLCNRYGRLLLDDVHASKGNREVGLALLRTAFAGVSRFATVANAASVQTSGYFCAAAEAVDGGFAITVGPDAQRLADNLYRVVPFRLVSPAYGAVRKDLQSRAPGIYVVRDAIVEGPLTVEAAAAKLVKFGLPGF